MSQIDPGLRTIILTHPPTHVVKTAPAADNPRGGQARCHSQPLSTLPKGTALRGEPVTSMVTPEEREEVSKPAQFISKPWPGSASILEQPASRSPESLWGVAEPPTATQSTLSKARVGL